MLTVRTWGGLRRAPGLQRKTSEPFIAFLVTHSTQLSTVGALSWMQPSALTHGVVAGGCAWLSAALLTLSTRVKGCLMDRA